MNARIADHLQELVKIVRENPALQKILEEDPTAEINPLLPDHIKRAAFLLGQDFLGIIQKTAEIVDKEEYDIAKIRRRVEEYLRKYATNRVIIGLALWFGVSKK